MEGMFHRVNWINRTSANRKRGFVLIYALWVLAGGVLLLGCISLWSQQRSKQVAVQLIRLKQAAMIESAAHTTMFHLLVAKDESLDIALGKLRRQSLPGARREIYPVQGLLDLNHADLDAIVRVLRYAHVPEAVARAKRLVALRPLQTYAMLEFVGIEDKALSCLLHNVTLSSGLRQPLGGLASPTLRRTLALQAPIGTSTQLGGSSVVVDAKVGDTGFALHLQPIDGVGRELIVELQLTGRSNHPIQILEWFWVVGRGTGGDKCE